MYALKQIFEVSPSVEITRDPDSIVIKVYMELAEKPVN
jgi:hypothetical protein